MTLPPLNRRNFLTLASAAGASAVLSAQRAGGPAAPVWAIGCHTRPFNGFRATQTANPDFILDAVKAAGYQYSDMISPATNPTLRDKLAARGLKSNIASLPTAAKGVSLPDAIAAARAVVTNAQSLGQKYALNLGIEDEERWLEWCKVLADAAAFGQERGVKVVVKHHHGTNNTSLDLLAWIKQVNHPNFGVFVDPGNIVYYTGKDPVKQTAMIAPHISGVVAKDCSAPHFMEREVGAPPFGSTVTGAGNPEVMIQFGTGKVDFAGLYKVLKSAGFNGPTMVEGTKVGATLEETIANARANREYLERVFADTMAP